MNKWAMGLRHLVPSVCGWLRTFVGHPGFALTLLLARIRFFLTRKLAHPLSAPGGFPIDTPDALIAFWAIVVERELYHASWADAVRRAELPLIVDVGANAGVFSYFIHTLNPRCEIIAFEPLPVMAAKVRALKQRAGMNLDCRELALSNAAGEAVLETVHGYDGTSRLASGTVAKQERGLRVRLSTLDAEIGPRDIVLMKIDVEGFEPEVLQGGPATLSRTSFVVAEAHSTAHLERITATLGPGWHRLQLGPCDYLFSRR
jgi:FkbM family methyltransferase